MSRTSITRYEDSLASNSVDGADVRWPLSHEDCAHHGFYRVESNVKIRQLGEVG